MSEKCPLAGCGKEFEPYEGMRKAQVNPRNPNQSEYWCKECQDEFDNIDWDEVNERRHDYGRYNDITYGEFFHE